MLLRLHCESMGSAHEVSFGLPLIKGQIQSFPADVSENLMSLAWHTLSIQLRMQHCIQHKLGLLQEGLEVISTMA